MNLMCFTISNSWRNTLLNRPIRNSIQEMNRDVKRIEKKYSTDYTYIQLDGEMGIDNYYKNVFNFDFNHDLRGVFQTEYIRSIAVAGKIESLPAKPRFLHLKDFVKSTDFIRSRYHKFNLFSSRIIDLLLENGATDLIRCPVRIYLQNDYSESISTDAQLEALEYTDDFSIIYPTNATRLFTRDCGHLSDAELIEKLRMIPTEIPYCIPEKLPPIFTVHQNHYGLYVTDDIRRIMQRNGIRGVNFEYQLQELPFKSINLQNSNGEHRQFISDEEISQMQVKYDTQIFD
jgi:hypothetical protein